MHNYLTFGLQAAMALSGTAIAAPDTFKNIAIKYSAVTGYFLQDDPTTSPSGFDYTAVNFGLINRTYDTDSTAKAGATQWERFAHKVAQLKHEGSPSVDYKVLFMGRHGEGFHNAAESYYGTPAWNCYWSLIDGNNTSIWSDAHLTQNGIKQARVAYDFWTHEISTQHIPTPESYWTSPLFRCLATANLTFSDLALPPTAHRFLPTVKELLREGISEHTCDRRSSLTYIARNFPFYRFEAGFQQEDPLWKGDRAETPPAQDARSKKVLDDIFSQPQTGTYVSITSHSGEIASILRVLGHRAFSLSTGAVIPVLVKYEKVDEVPTTTVPWTASAHCTEPPVTSVSSAGCICPKSAVPVTTTLAGATPINTI